MGLEVKFKFAKQKSDWLEQFADFFVIKGEY
jgi:hypothetical protein